MPYYSYMPNVIYFVEQGNDNYDLNIVSRALVNENRLI